MRRAAKSLIALGVGKGDKADILSYSNYRWVLTDLALATIGSCAVGIYHSLLAKDVQHIVNHSDGVVVFAEDRGQAKTVRDPRPMPDHPQGHSVQGYAHRRTTGSSRMTNFWIWAPTFGDEALDARIEDVDADDVATIVYTSGTTGIPKGAVLTHDNLTFTAQSVRHSFSLQDDDETLLFLPFAHVFARTCVFTAIFIGTTTVFRPRYQHHQRGLQDRPPALVPERAPHL